jgi:DNA-binding transcriptional MocR family regulator
MLDGLASGIQSTCWMTPPLMAEIASQWIEDGTAGKILEQRRQEARERQTLLRQVLDGHSIQSSMFGYHAWLKLPARWTPQALVQSARHRGVTLTSTEAFLVGHGQPPQRVRLCLGVEQDRGRLEQGLRIVGELLASAPRRAKQVV